MSYVDYVLWYIQTLNCMESKPPPNKKPNDEEVGIERLTLGDGFQSKDEFDPAMWVQDSKFQQTSLIQKQPNNKKPTQPKKKKGRKNSWEMVSSDTDENLKDE